MTQPISPDEGDAVKAFKAYMEPSDPFARGFNEGLTAGAEACAKALTRTDPPVAMDEVEALAKEFEKVDGYRGDIHRTLARIALTRIKDSSNG